jgi:hypothetical protein
VTFDIGNAEDDMKPSELFGVVVRSLGLLVMLPAMWCIFWAILNLVLGGPNAVGMLVAGIPALLLGTWLLLGASGLAAAVYSNEAKRDQ